MKETGKGEESRQILKRRKLERRKKPHPKYKAVGFMTIGTTLGETISLEKYVVYRWKLAPDMEADKYILRMEYHRPQKKHNMKQKFFHYQVQKNTDGAPILVRVSK